MNRLKELLNNFYSNVNPEQKQRIKIFILAVIIFGILFGVVNFSSNKQEKKHKIKKDNLYKLKIIPEGLKKDIEKHRLVYKVKVIQNEQAELTKKVIKIEKNVEDIQAQLKSLLKAVKETKKLNKRIKKLSKEIKNSTKEIRRLSTITKKLALKSKNEKIKKLIQDNRTFNERVKEKKEIEYYTPVNNPEVLILPEEKKKKSLSDKPKSKYDKTKPERKEIISRKIKIFKKEIPQKIQKKEIVEKINIKISGGSFIQGVLLTGLDAPTSGSAQSNPVPVLIKVEKEAIMPNKFRMNIKGCFIIAGGYGDLSTERAIIRTETLSCMTDDGKSIEVPLKGHVVDIDGKMGLRGRLVSKAGQLLAKSLLAGFISGISKIFRPQFIPAISVEPKSNTLFQTPKASDVFLSGSLSGTSEALEKIADYYMKLAEKTFPVIEVQAGRPVEIFILKGQKLITRKIKKIEYKVVNSSKKSNRRKNK